MNLLRWTVTVLALLVMVLVMQWSVSERTRVRVVDSAPTAGQRLATPIQAVSLTFDKVPGSESAVTVTDDRGIDVAGPVRMLDERQVAVAVDAYQAGRYDVEWAVRGGNGETSTGSFHFVITDP